MRRKLGLSLVGLLCMALGALAQDGYQLWVNGNPSKIPVKAQDRIVVPVSFPAEVEERVWTVTVRRDDKTRRIEVKTVPDRSRQRGENPCHVCLHTGLCQTCYPAGSGNNTAGQPDYNCTATGKCPYCGGAGQW